MAFNLRKTKTFVHPCPVVQMDEDGKQHAGVLRVRFNAIPRNKWNEIVDADEDDDRLLYDVIVDSIEDEVEVEGNVLDKAQALEAVRQDMSLTGQIVDHGLKYLFGAHAKNAKRSRSR